MEDGGWRMEDGGWRMEEGGGRREERGEGSRIWRMVKRRREGREQTDDKIVI